MKKYKHTKQKMTEKASFYIAMSVCVMAVGMALWSAYNAFSTDNDSTDQGYFSSLSSATAPVGKDLTGVTEKETEQSSDTSKSDVTEQTETETQIQEKTRSFALSETAPDESSAESESSALSAMQAVLKVDESLVYPVKSRKVTKEYSENNIYNNTMKDYRAHTGCDFAAEEGENVYAMCSGTVQDITVSELYGVIIEVDCGDFTVYYCGLDSEFNVEKGDEISSGDTIGVVGHIPSESNDDPHIHIEVRVGDKLIDPLSVIESDS